MVRRFENNRPSRALQVWQILIAAAHNRQILTYKMLAALVGYGGAGVFAQILGHVAYYCKQNHLPPLTSLVVNEKTGLPGTGIPIKDAPKKREEVFSYKWFRIMPPTIEQLREAAERAES